MCIRDRLQGVKTPIEWLVEVVSATLLSIAETP